MTRGRFARPSSHYLAQFDAAAATFYPDEAEISFDRDGEELTVSVPAAERVADPDAIAAARSVVAQLAELDAQATGYLFALPNWPYGEDADLWLLIVQHDNVRFCYAQRSVNDEQIIGFSRSGDAWVLQGPDPRFRGKGDNPYTA